MELFIRGYILLGNGERRLNKGSIYCSLDRTNGMMYIGKTSKDRPESRITDHKRADLDSYFHRAIRDHGIENFDFIWFHYKSIHPDNLDDMERYYIKKYNTMAPNGYNLTSGGEGGILSAETKEKISRSHKGKAKSEDHKKKISETLSGINHPNYGRTLPEETKRKISESHKGRKFTEEHKRNLSEAHKGHKHSEETKRKMSKAHKGQIISEKQKAQISKVHKGKVVSKETRKKISESVKKAWERKKLLEK